MAPPSHTPVHAKRHRVQDVEDLDAEPLDMNLLGSKDFGVKVLDWTKENFVLFLKREDLKPFGETFRNQTENTKYGELVHKLEGLVDNIHQQLENKVKGLQDITDKIQESNSDLSDTLRVEVSRLHRLVADLTDNNKHLQLQVQELTNMQSTVSKQMETMSTQKSTNTDKTSMEGITEEVTPTGFGGPATNGITVHKIRIAVDELMVLHERFKETMVKNMRKFSEQQLKENTNTPKEYQEFKQTRKILNKWFVSGQILKKTLASTESISQTRYLHANWKFSQTASRDPDLNKVNDHLRATCEQTDLLLKYQNVMAITKLIDDLTEAFQGGAKDLIFAKAFKVIVRSHRNLQDNVLFRPRRQPFNGRSRHAPDRQLNTNMDDQQPGYGLDNRRDFPSLDREHTGEDNNDVFDQHSPRFTEPGRRRPRWSSRYQQQPRYDSYWEEEPWDESHIDNTRWVEEDNDHKHYRPPYYTRTGRQPEQEYYTRRRSNNNTGFY
jgi:hypothetical protein